MRRLLRPVLRWVLVLAGALIGSYAGRAAAAAMRGEEVQPLLRVTPGDLFRADLMPGMMAAELIGKFVDLSPTTAALVAAAGSAVAAFADGPFVGRDDEPAWGGDYD
jgi:hypothetical protein